MNTSPLTVLRLAHKSAPSLRQIARKIKLSAAMLSMFELGRATISEEKMKAYAKVLGSTLAEVKKRYLQVAYMHHAQRARELRALLVKDKGRPRRGGPVKAFPQSP